MIKPNYVCPYLIGRSDIPFLTCSKQLKKDFREYKTVKECEQIICGHQYFCNKVGRWENTRDAEKCPFNK